MVLPVAAAVFSTRVREVLEKGGALCVRARTMLKIESVTDASPLAAPW